MGVDDGPPNNYTESTAGWMCCSYSKTYFFFVQATSIMARDQHAQPLCCLPPNLIYINRTPQPCINSHPPLPPHCEQYRIGALAAQRLVTTGALRYSLQSEQRTPQCSLRHWWQSCSHMASAWGAEVSLQVANKWLQLVENGCDGPVICIER